MTFGRYTLAPGPEWTSLAANWPVRYVVRLTDEGHWLTDVVHVDLAGRPVAQAHLVCAECDQSVWCLHPGTPAATGGAYGYTFHNGDVLSGILAHIRQHHPEASVG